MNTTIEDVKEKLNDFIDTLEDYYGKDLLGFEVRLSHPINNGSRQSYANIDEFILIFEQREAIGDLTL